MQFSVQNFFKFENKWKFVLKYFQEKLNGDTKYSKSVYVYQNKKRSLDDMFNKFFVMWARIARAWQQ